MNNINFSVNDKDLQAVLTILKSLKPNMIHELNVSKPQDKKYINKSAYKNKILNDEFIATKSSSSKYLSKDEFKQRLSKKV